MAELSARDGYLKTVNFVQQIIAVKKQIRENFEEMDFENADKRETMEQQVETMERLCSELIGELSGMSFQ